MEYLIIFSAAVIVAAALVYQLTLLLMRWVRTIAYNPHDHVYPVYTWIIALAATIFVIWKTSFFVVGQSDTFFSPGMIVLLVITIPSNMAIMNRWFIDLAEIIKKGKKKEVC